MVKVTLMTMQIAKGETVELPMMIGRFYTPEEARAYMEQYWQEKEQHLTKEELEPVTIDRA
jgi:chromosome segregation and condensation protein ScpB